MPFYAVAVGRHPGVYSRWDQARLQVNGFSGNIHKKFDYQEDAVAFIRDVLQQRQEDGGIEFNEVKNPPMETTEMYVSDYCEAFQVDDDGFVHVYTDGSCLNNGKNEAVAGIGVFFDYDHHLNISRRISGKQSNIVAEIKAVLAAIEVAEENDIGKLRICTDSLFLINAHFHYIPKWKRNGWRLASGGPVENKSLMQRFSYIVKNANMTIRWSFVPSHKGCQGNEMADQLAKQGTCARA